MSFCKTCGVRTDGSDYCSVHTPQGGFSAWHFIVLFICTLVMGALFGWCSKPEPVIAEPTLVTREVVRTVVVTSTPMPTSVPTLTPTPTPIYRAQPIDHLVQWDAEIAAKVVSSEAGGMGRSGKQLIACNVLADFYDVSGRWELLTNRWMTLQNVLDGNTPLDPGEPDETAVNIALDTDICNEYPRCKFLGTTADLYTWLTLKYVSAGSYRLWLGNSGQMLVCVEGVPDLPEPMVK